MNPHSNGYSPRPFFLNGSRPPLAFNRPPPHFPPPRMGFRPPGHNGFHTRLDNSNNNMGPNGFHQPHFNNNGHSRFSNPPPNVRGPPPNVRGPPPNVQGPPLNVRGPSPGPPRPMFSPDNIFGPPPNVTRTGQEGFPFTTNQQQSQPPPQTSGRGGRGRGDWSGRGRGGFPNSRPQQGKKKKEKVDKRDLAENNTFFCDTCDRGFKTQEKYQEHVDGHMKCSYKDCPFIAAPKLVQLHIALQHRTGLAKKVWSMESEEDVKKWREERKRKFPTAANIAKKKEEDAERIARGEVLRTKDFSAMRGGAGRGRGRGRGGRGQARGQNRRGRGRGGRFHSGPDAPVAEESRGKNGGKSEGSDNSDEDDDAPPAEIAISHSHSPDGMEEKESKKLERSDADEENGNAESREEECVLESGSPNTSSLGLLASYGYSSSEEEDERKAKESVKESQKSDLMRDPDTAADHQFQPSPSKRPRLLPNPFLSQNTQQNSGSEQVEPSSSPLKVSKEQPDCTVLAAVNTRNSPTKSSPSKGVDLENHSKAEEHNDGGSKHVKSPRETKQSPCKTGTAEVHASATDSSHLSTAKHSSIEDGESREKAKEGNRKGGKSKHQDKRQAAGKSGSGHLKYTLLEKLLAPDIRRERNKILQCVHYIVKNKFFDPVSTSAASSTLPS